MQRPYLIATEIINYHHPSIQRVASDICSDSLDDITRCKAAFEFVRDRIAHSFDIEAEEVTCKASHVLEKEHGICYAKSHLLTAILRAMNIPAGICYQRQVFDETISEKMCIHALNAAYLSSLVRWVRFDARGNKEGVNAQFSLGKEQLAFPIREELGEKDYPEIHAKPLPSVIKALMMSKNCMELKHNLPEDISP